MTIYGVSDCCKAPLTFGDEDPVTGEDQYECTKCHKPCKQVNDDGEPNNSFSGGKAAADAPSAGSAG